MQTYAEYQPTGLDPKGAFLPDRQDWLVMPLGRNRDSQALEESNFDTALKILGGEQEDLVEVHRFGHWGPGWFEIILVKSTEENVTKAEEIQERLENYPVLDKEDFSRREWEDFCESWKSFGHRQFMDTIATNLELTEDARDHLRDIDEEISRELFQQLAAETSCSSMNIAYAAKHIQIGQLIQLLWRYDHKNDVVVPSRARIALWIDMIKDEFEWDIPMPQLVNDSQLQTYLWPEIKDQEMNYLIEMLGLEHYESPKV